MEKMEHVIVAYGNQLGYHHGAKFQILSAWRKWYSKSDVGVCVATDKPELFEDYPVRLVQITEQNAFDWSLNGIQHFGIKLRALEKAILTSEIDVSLLLDTDTYWKKNPRTLANRIKPNHAVMFCDEGQVKGARNLSIKRFDEGLENREIPWANKSYKLSNLSHMYNSSIVGLHKKNIDLLARAFELFSALEPHVEAHTVEQFSLGETFRLNGVSVSFGSRYTRDWSSIGRKNYATPILKDFFETFGENDFDTHLKQIDSIKIRRPFKTLIQQKIARLKGNS
jgi:hypothetical protein